MFLTWFGTASICIRTGDSEVITDPFVPLDKSRVKINVSDYKGHDTVLVTHGHIDHIGSLPELYADEERKIYCSMTPRATLTSMGIPERSLYRTCDGDRFYIDKAQSILVTAFKGCHIKFDLKLILRTLISTRMFTCASNIIPFIRLNRICREGGETLHYLIEAEGKRLFVLGSSALAPGVNYPKHCDLLIMPYSGRSDIYRVGLDLVSQLEPWAVLIDHFDDTFPPISSDVDPDAFIREMRNRGIKVIRPKHLQSIEF